MAAATEESTPPDMATRTRAPRGAGNTIGRRTRQPTTSGRGEPARLQGQRGEHFGDAIDARVGRKRSDAHPDCRAREFVADAYGLEHIRRAHTPALASRPTGARDAVEVERHQHGLAVGPRDGNIEQVRGALGATSVDDSVRQLREDGGLEAVAQRAKPRAFLFAPRDRKFGRRREADRARDVLRPRTAPAVLHPAEEQRLQWRAAPDVHGADSLRRADLVPADREEIERDRFRIDRNFPERLHTVRMKNRAHRLGMLGERGDGLDGANLVVDPHHGTERGIVAHQLAKRIARHDAVDVNGQFPLLGALARSLMNGLENRLVFDRRGRDRIAPLRLEHTPPAEHGEVVAFGAARSEAELVGVGTEAVGHALTRLIEGGPCLPAPSVRAGRVPEARAEERRHRLQHFRPDRRGRRVIQIDGGGRSHAPI